MLVISTLDTSCMTGSSNPLEASADVVVLCWEWLRVATPGEDLGDALVGGLPLEWAPAALPSSLDCPEMDGIASALLPLGDLDSLPFGACNDCEVAAV